MARLRSVVLLTLLFGTATAANAQVDRWAGLISEASDRFGVPERWIREVMRTESGGSLTLHGTPIVSRAGAMGLMQLMPATWADMRALHGLGADPFDPRDNILAGAAYLRAMYDRFGYPGLFAAYNAGPARYAAVMNGRALLPHETRNYVGKLSLRTHVGTSSSLQSQSPADLFNHPLPEARDTIFAIRH